jgi:hypothetical protein
MSYVFATGKNSNRALRGTWAVIARSTLLSFHIRYSAERHRCGDALYYRCIPTTNRRLSYVTLGPDWCVVYSEPRSNWRRKVYESLSQ